MKELTLNIKRKRRRNSDQNTVYNSFSQTRIDDRHHSEFKNTAKNTLNPALECSQMKPRFLNTKGSKNLFLTLTKDKRENLKEAQLSKSLAYK